VISPIVTSAHDLRGWRQAADGGAWANSRASSRDQPDRHPLVRIVYSTFGESEPDPQTEEVPMSARQSEEEKMMRFDRRPRIIAGVIGLLAVVAVVLLVAYMIASGFVTG
jgi:hypothetical protein